MVGIPTMLATLLRCKKNYFYLSLMILYSFRTVVNYFFILDIFRCQNPPPYHIKHIKKIKYARAHAPLVVIILEQYIKFFTNVYFRVSNMNPVAMSMSMSIFQFV